MHQKQNLPGEVNLYKKKYITHTDYINDKLESLRFL